MRVTKTLSIALCASLLTFAACDKDADPEPSGADKAAADKAEKDKEFKEHMKEVRAEKQAKEDAAKKAEEDRLAAVDAICVAPEKLPKKFDKACKEVGDAQDRFMVRLYEGDAITRWNGAKAMQMGMTVGNCTKHFSMEAAACATVGLDAATPEQKKALPDILRICGEKYPKPAADAPAE